MSGNNFKLRFSLLMLLAVMVSAVPMFAASAVIGSVAGSTNATVGGQALVPHTTLFSGDSLRVDDGAAVVAMGMGSRAVFGRDTVASFERSTDEVSVLLGQGNVSIYRPEDGVALRVKIGDVTVATAKGFKTLGEVAMVNGVVVVTAKEGMLKVEGPGKSQELTKGKSIAIMPSKAEGKPGPQAGSASNHWSQSQWVAVVTLAGVGVNTAFSIADYQKAKDAQTTAAKADADALQAAADANAATAAATQADADAKAALAAANQAIVIGKEACRLISSGDPVCQ